MASYQFKEYNEETETFETFYERLEQFLILEEAGDEKKKAYLLTLMGSKTYSVLKNLCSPILPKDKTFDNLIDILKRHFSPKRSIVVERFIFFKRMQLKEESISDYLVEIKRLASSCNFGNFLEDSLRDKMVCGLYNAKIQNRILSEGDISLAKVIEIALSMEAAEKNTKLFHLEQGEDCVDKLRMERKVESNFQNGKCKHCGKQHKELCRFKEAICFKCNKKGHIASICWSSRRNLRQHQNQPGNIHQIGDQEEEEEYVQKIISVTIPEYKINFASSDPPYLMELKVEGNFIKFEMDTGSGLTLISEKDFKNSLQHLKLEKASIIVRTYDGTVVPILGKINVKVECQDITYKLRALVVKGEKRALMGREWINRLKLGCFAVKHMPVEITIEEILKENQALFVETTEPIKGFTFSVNMCDVNPIFHKARPVPFAIRPAVTEALDKMVAKGYLCEVASSKWATPVVVVPKKNKEIRICCDFKVTLNKYLDTAAYPLPTQQDLFSTLAKGKYFSKLDLRNAYLQLEVDPGTRPLLTINTHKGLFRFKRMPFGLANAPSYFQSVMDRVLSGIGGVICYIDDVLIATASIEEHLALLKTIFARLAKYNIKLKKEKCLFLQKEIEYLGHLVTEEGIRPLDHKVQAIQKAKTPTNISELRSFLGLVNFYGKFIPNLPELLKPLHELLHKKRPWVWTKECGEAIDKCKNSITSERVLVPYDATLPLCLATDASQIGVGAVLSHIIEGQERPIMFASRTLSVAEQNYSQIEKEALAIIYGVTKFHQFIYGRKFILITDHKPLVTILGSRSGIPTLSTSRLQRWALILSAYTYDIKFRRTQDHGNADLLSRFPVGCEEIPRLNNVYALSYVEELPITAEEIATETEKDEVLSLAKFYTQQGWPEKVADHLRPYFQRKLELTVDGECLVWGMRVVIPPSLRIKMLNCLHETHSGMNKMKAVARSHFWWPNLDTQIEFLVNKCRSCQQSQDGPNKGKWQPWKWSTRPWQRIHIDFANKENINLLIVVDSHSKWIEAIPMRETTTRKTIEQLRRLFSSYGLPEELVSDNGPQFTGSEMKGFLEGNGIKQTLIPAYHPQSNGLAERAVRTIKTALDKNKRKIGDTIQDTLSKVLLAYRSTPHVTTGKTPSELFIGRALRTRVSLIHPSLASRVRDQQARQMKYDRRTHLEEFQIDDLVWCKNFRGGDKWIPGKIVGKKGTRVYTILIHGQVKAYHRDQIRKRWRNGEEDESGDGEHQPEHSRGAGPSAIISEVVRDRGYMESLSPGLTSQRSDQDSEVQSDTDDGKSLEPLRSLDPEALKEEGPVLRRNPPRARRPPESGSDWYSGSTGPVYRQRDPERTNHPQCRVRITAHPDAQVHGMHLFRRPTASSAARGTGTANADIDQSRRPTKRFGQCKRSQNHQPRFHNNQVKPETPQPSRLFETEVGSLTQLTVKLFLAPNIPCPFLIDTGASLNIVPYNLYHMLKTHLPNLTLEGHSLNLQTLNGFAKTMGKLSIPLTIGQISRRENFHVVNAPLPFGILSINSLHKFRLTIDFNKCTIFQLGAPLSTPSYHFNKVPNVCTYWQCQAMSQRSYHTAKSSAYDNHCVHSLKNTPLPTCPFFTKANCLFYMPSNNKATTALTCKKPAQNMSIQQDNSHTKHIGDHTSSHNYHMTKPHNELDTPIDTQQNPLPHAYYNTTSNTHYTPQFTTLLQRYTHIFTQNKFNVPCLRIPPVKIPTNSDKIITIRPYRVPICDQQEIRNQVQQMLKNGIIEQSFSPFSSPVTLVTKRDKTKRFCIDYRKVNELISSDVHPLPRIEDILDHLAQAKYFSTADISSAYWQVPIHPDSRPLLAFATLERLYQPTRLPFGLKTSPQIYERAISQVLQRHGLDCVAHYFDDFIIYSNTLEEHQNHLRQFFAFCEAEKLQLNFVKCEFFKQSIDFLGYTITAGTITPLTRNTDIIHAIKQPHNRKTLQSFLGAVNVYNKFIPEYARLRAPLNNLLKKDVVWNWNEVCQEAFIDLKGNLTQHPILHLYKEGLPCQVYCDASTLGIAGILKQVHPDGNVYPVQYFSRTLRPHEKNYSISELECLAIVESVEKFRIYLMGRKFTIFSDHHALQWLKTIKNPSGRLFRWSLRLSSYEYEIRYIKGKLQYEADLLSRNPFFGFLDATLIKTHQPPPSKESSLTIDRNGLHTVSRKGVTKIIIPKPLIQRLLQTVHTQYNHPGISQMSRLISTQYYWQARDWPKSIILGNIPNVGI
ncbi:K02A2.6-like, partial [Cordylochernes scorpioides]